MFLYYDLNDYKMFSDVLFSLLILILSFFKKIFLKLFIMCTDLSIETALEYILFFSLSILISTP